MVSKIIFYYLFMESSLLKNRREIQFRLNSAGDTVPFRQQGLTSKLAQNIDNFSLIVVVFGKCKKGHF